MPAVTFGLDISHHQNAALDLARCRREGIEFVILKATEGAGFTDPEFAANLAEARRAGLLVAAYHYQRPGSAAAQLARIRQTVPLDVPVVLDVEAGSGPVALTRDLVGRLRGAGYRVPLTYLPRWYWQQIGAPSLAGLPPLWSSRYPDNIVGSIADEWADVPAHYWNGYGGLGVAILQFTSSAAIAGHHPIDANAYRGTRTQLAALLLGGEEDTVSWTDNLTFDPPGPVQPVTFSAGTWLMWTNWYANMIPSLVATCTQILAAVTNDPDVTPDQIKAMLDQAVSDNMPTAEQVAAAQRPFLADLVRDVVPAEQAELIIDKLAEKLGAPAGDR